MAAECCSWGRQPEVQPNFGWGTTFKLLRSSDLPVAFDDPCMGTAYFFYLSMEALSRVNGAGRVLGKRENYVRKAFLKTQETIVS